NDLLVGSCCQSGPAELSAEGAQTIVAGLSGETGGISVHGGAVAANLSFIRAGGTQSITTGGGLSVTAGSAAVAKIVAGSDQTITADGDIDLFGSNAGSTPVFAQILQSGAGTQRLSGNALALHGHTDLQSGGAQNLSVTGAITVDSGSAAAEHARVLAASGQDISAASLHIHAVGGNEAAVRNSASGNQTLQIGAGGLDVVNDGPGGLAALENLGGGQSISVTNADNVFVIGRAGTARIESLGAQTLSMTGSAANSILVGENGAAGRSSMEAGGTQSLTAGSGSESGSITLIAGSDAGFDAVLSAGGTQLIASTGALTLAGSNGGSAGHLANAQIVQTAGGEQHLTAASLSLSGLATVASATSQRIDVAGSLFIHSGATAGEDTAVAAEGGQIVNAGGLYVHANGPSQAALLNNASGSGNASAQTVTINGSSGNQGLQVTVDAAGGLATVANRATGGQTLTINGSAGADVKGSAGAASIAAAGAQTLALSGGTGANLLSVGGASNAGASVISAGAGQTISATAISLHGGAADGAEASLRAAGTQQVSAQNIALQGGTAPGSTAGARAMILQTNSARLQTVQARNLTLSGGAGGSRNFALIEGDGGQSFTLGDSANAGTLTLAGGTSTNTRNFAQILQPTAGKTLTINVLGGGSVSLSGGHGADRDFAEITSLGSLVSLDFGTAGGSLDLAGGSNGSINHARIDAQTGDLSIAGRPDIALTGGLGGLADAGNGARISSFSGQVTILAHDIAITGAVGTSVDSGSRIGAPHSAIDASGNVTLIGSAAGATGRSGAGIQGARVSGAETTVDIHLNVAGQLSLTGGDGEGGSVVGQGLSASGLTGNVVEVTAGSIVLNAGSNAAARIGYPSSNSGSLTITTNSLTQNGGAGATFIQNEGDISIFADAMALGGSIHAAAGTVFLAPRSAGTRVALGVPDGAGVLGLSGAELETITAAAIVIGNVAAPAQVSVDGPLSANLNAPSLSLNGSTVTINSSVDLSSGGVHLILNSGSATGDHVQIAGDVLLGLGTFDASASPVVTGGNHSVNALTILLDRLSVPAGSQFGLGGTANANNVASANSVNVAGSLTTASEFTVSGLTSNSGQSSFLGLTHLDGGLDISGGTVSFGLDVNLPGLTMSGGSLAGTTNITLSGPYALSGGSIGGSGNLLSQGSGSVDGAFVLDTRTWTNSGTLGIVGSGALMLVNGAHFVNASAGTVNLNSSAAEPITYGGGAAGTFDNLGLVTQNAAGAHGMNANVTFNQSATVHVTAGSFVPNNGTDSGATYSMDAGARVDYTSGTRTLSGSNTYDGAGSARLAGANWALSGAVSLGGTSTLELQSGAIGSGTLATSLAVQVSGSPVLNGTQWTNNGTLDLTGAGTLVFT
ncbi:MAG: hypothetical protein JNJ60_00380, partial [Rhodocyclaceae bacterium]|nr:hypothetical protein [Rhodocyclaceae bacterium]